VALLRIVPFEEAGKALREIRRKSKGITSQKEIRDKTKWAISTISKLEDDGNWNKEQILEYCNILGLGTPYIIFAMDDEDVKRLLNSQP
jgi:hypothetical protein